jgi:hypothetical protein
MWNVTSSSERCIGSVRDHQNVFRVPVTFLVETASLASDGSLRPNG